MLMAEEEKLTDVEINTVDGFQGAEKDIIIISCVRSGITLRSIIPSFSLIQIADKSYPVKEDNKHLFGGFNLDQFHLLDFIYQPITFHF